MDEMENKDLEQEETVTEEAPKYIPRPAWQVWTARIALVLFIALILMYYWNISRGNL